MQIEISNYRAYAKGALKGFFNISIPEIGLKIFKCRHFSQGDREWFNFPSEEVKKENDETQYFPYASISHEPPGIKLREQIMTALRGQNNGQVPSAPRPKNTLHAETPFSFGETPF